ncbi:rCG36549 [Rattus norvegicus]|uniref:RCG36549 n=1 Tax=Rattus norvegicus TaxID=10116 RepID=A6JS25_RAT|nr:rCG36549 [Rattus norvegicus]
MLPTNNQGKKKLHPPPRHPSFRSPFHNPLIQTSSAARLPPSCSGGRDPNQKVPDREFSSVAKKLFVLGFFCRCS